MENTIEKKLVAPTEMRGHVVRCNSFTMHEGKIIVYLIPSELNEQYTKDNDTWNWHNKTRQRNQIDFINRWAKYRVYDICFTPEGGAFVYKISGQDLIQIFNSDGSPVEGGKEIY
jgi:hypothetical protein